MIFKIKLGLVFLIYISMCCILFLLLLLLRPCYIVYIYIINSIAHVFLDGGGRFGFAIDKALRVDLEYLHLALVVRPR
jgi:hypothetical protein